MTATGTGFVAGSAVHWNGADRVTAFVSATQVKAAITAADVASPVSVPVTVTNPAPGGGTSNALVFVVTTAPTPGKPVPITVAPDGSPPNGPSLNGGLSFLGRNAIFASKASNLVPGDTNDAWDVFVRDTCRGRPGCTPSTQRVSLTSTGQQITGKPSVQPGHMRWDGEVVIFATAADGVVQDDTNGLADVFTRGVCHDTTSCVTTTTRVSIGANGLQGNGPSVQPRGNYDAWAGPEWATFFSTASNFWPDAVPTPYYGAIFRTSVY